jgi:hypothetical protein
LKLYGYSEEKLSAEGLLALKEVSIKASPDRLDEIASFLSSMASQIRQGKMKTDHVHLPVRVSEPEIIVLNPGLQAKSEEAPNQSSQPTPLKRRG